MGWVADEWRAVHQIMHGSAQSFARLHITNRIITHPGPDMAEWVRTRTLVEAVHGAGARAGRSTKVLDSRTRHLLVAAIRHLPEHEREVAECELAVLDHHDRQLPGPARIRRWIMGGRIASVILGFVLLWLGLDWSGIAAMTAVIIASYAIEAVAWLTVCAAARRIWHAYAMPNMWSRKAMMSAHSASTCSRVAPIPCPP